MVKSYHRIFINGEWVAPSSSERIAVINPASEEVCAHVPAAKEADIGREFGPEGISSFTESKSIAIFDVF